MNAGIQHVQYSASARTASGRAAAPCAGAGTAGPDREGVSTVRESAVSIPMKVADLFRNRVSGARIAAAAGSPGIVRTVTLTGCRAGNTS